MKAIKLVRARSVVALFAVSAAVPSLCALDNNKPHPKLPVYEDPVSKINYPSLFTIPLTPSQLPKNLKLPSISSVLPTTLTFTSEKSTNDAQGIFQTQQAFDLFSWQTFVAINWPAHTDTNNYGKPKSQVIGTDPQADRVWETFIPPRLVFQKGGVTPQPYVPPAPRPCNIDAIGKRSHLLNEMDEAFFNLEKPLPPIIDNNTNYARYEIRFNKVQYDYIQTNKLYSVEGQKKFISSGGRITLPNGSIELKVAWKKMGAGDDTNRFFTQLADVLENPYTNSSKILRDQLYGLIGMHIMYKVPGVPQWVWPTFEHVDNAPVSDLRVLSPTRTNRIIGDWRWAGGNWKYAPPKAKYSFFNATLPFGAGIYATNLSIGGFNPASRAAMDAANKGRGAWPDDYYQRRSQRIPSQITKVITENNSIVASKWTAALNAAMQNQLRQAAPNGPWQNYRLLTTQWPVNPSTWTNYVANHETTVGAGTVRAGNPAPVSIGNAVAETYMQINGSCMNCHSGATVMFHATGGVYGTNQPYSDFSFMFQRAHSQSTTSK